MSVLSEEVLDFDQNDVRTMIEMLKKFDRFHKGTGFPDYSEGYVAYLPVFAVALLQSQNKIEKLSSRIERLTWALVLLTLAMLATIVLS